MHIHFIGICGTFMAGLAALAKQKKYKVTGSDKNVYPPMSTQLNEQGIDYFNGFSADNFAASKPDCVVVGNATSRGNPELEYVLQQGWHYVSGPQWLAEQVLQDRWVLAVAGTHGKTTTSTLLAWILENAGLKPGFLIGGVPENFPVSARLGDSKFFVIEADEYDSAFCDKRSKFVHYRPRTLILNNLEYDHADIFPDLNAIKQQFHILVRTVPANGLIICPNDDEDLKEVLAMGCWTATQTFALGAGDWQATQVAPDGSRFEIVYQNKPAGKVSWNLMGKHNVQNALAAVAAAHHAGVSITEAIAGLESFQGIKRRMQVRGQVNDITVYDDFAHHPTAIATTLQGLRQHVGAQRIIAILELASYTMKTGTHRESLLPALAEADLIFFAKPEQEIGLEALAAGAQKPTTVHSNVASIVQDVVKVSQPGDHLLVMSNKGFDDIHEKLLTALQTL